VSATSQIHLIFSVTSDPNTTVQDVMLVLIVERLLLHHLD